MCQEHVIGLLPSKGHAGATTGSFGCLRLAASSSAPATVRAVYRPLLGPSPPRVLQAPSHAGAVCRRSRPGGAARAAAGPLPEAFTASLTATETDRGRKRERDLRKRKCLALQKRRSGLALSATCHCRGCRGCRCRGCRAPLLPSRANRASPPRRPSPTAADRTCRRPGQAGPGAAAGRG